MLYGVYSQQGTTTPPILPQGYMVVRIGNSLQKTYDMVNFTTLATETSGFNYAKYNPTNNSIYYSNGSYTIKRLNLNNNTVSNVVSTSTSNQQFQLNITNNSLIFSASSTQITRVNLANNAITNVNISHNSFQDAIVYSHYVIFYSIVGSQTSFVSTNGTTWTQTINVTATGGQAYVTPKINKISTYFYYTGSGNRNRGVSFDGGINRISLYNDTNTTTLGTALNFRDDEYLIQRTGSRVVDITLNAASPFTRYTLPGSTNYTIRNGAVSPNGTYIITTNNNSHQILRKTTALTSSSWTVSNPFPVVNYAVYYTDRFIAINNNQNSFTSTNEGVTWNNTGVNYTGTGLCYVPE